MKLWSKIAGIFVVLSFCNLPGHAWPSGPSAKEAARLKTYTPNNYLAHYLPDDRYKIAGGIWKYVSTSLDTYYHLPTSPLMLRQSADIVIGFSSAAEAEEAGYKRESGMGSGMAFTFANAGMGNISIKPLDQLSKPELLYIKYLQRCYYLRGEALVSKAQRREPTPAQIQAVQKLFADTLIIKPPSRFAAVHQGLVRGVQLIRGSNKFLDAALATPSLSPDALNFNPGHDTTKTLAALKQANKNLDTMDVNLHQVLEAGDRADKLWIQSFRLAQNLLGPSRYEKMVVNR